MITGATKLCSIEKLMFDLGWDSLQERRNKHKLTVFFKIINGLTPRYLSEVLPPLVQENNPYSLRYANALHPMHANTNLFFLTLSYLLLYKHGTNFQKKLKKQTRSQHLNIVLIETNGHHLNIIMLPQE